MAMLIRVEGDSGTKIYSGSHFTEQSAKQEYLDETGYEAEKVDITDFDVIEWNELQDFVRRGNDE